MLSRRVVETRENEAVSIDGDLHTRHDPHLHLKSFETRRFHGHLDRPRGLGGIARDLGDPYDLMRARSRCIGSPRATPSGSLSRRSESGSV